MLVVPIMVAIAGGEGEECTASNGGGSCGGD